MAASGAVPLARFWRPRSGLRDTALYLTLAKNSKLECESPQFSILARASLLAAIISVNRRGSRAPKRAFYKPSRLRFETEVDGDRDVGGNRLAIPSGGGGAGFLSSNPPPGAP